MPTARISVATRANEPFAVLNSGFAQITTERPRRVPAGSPPASPAADHPDRHRRQRVAQREEHRAAAPVQLGDLAFHQIRPRRPIQSPTRRITVRTGTGASAEVSSGTESLHPAPAPARWSLPCGQLLDPALEHRDHVGARVVRALVVTSIRSCGMSRPRSRARSDGSESES